MHSVARETCSPARVKRVPGSVDRDGELLCGCARHRARVGVEPSRAADPSVPTSAEVEQPDVVVAVLCWMVVADRDRPRLDVGRRWLADLYDVCQDGAGFDVER